MGKMGKLLRRKKAPNKFCFIKMINNLLDYIKTLQCPVCISSVMGLIMFA